MDMAHLQLIRDFFATQNRWDEEAHKALVEPSLKYFGSTSGLHAEGLAHYLGILRGAKNMGILRAEPRRIFGLWPHFAVLVEIQFDPQFGKTVEGIWNLHFTENGKVDELSIIWSPTGSIPL